MKIHTYIIVILLLGFSLQLQAQKTESSNIKYAISIENNFLGTAEGYFSADFAFIHSLTINKKHAIGLGFGVGLDIEIYLMVETNPVYCPVFANYRYYFTTNKLSPFINFSLGGNMYENAGKMQSSLSVGFKKGVFVLSSGVFLQAFQAKSFYFDSTSDGKYFPLGFTLKLGVAF